MTGGGVGGLMAGKHPLLSKASLMTTLTVLTVLAAPAFALSLPRVIPLAESPIAFEVQDGMNVPVPLINVGKTCLKDGVIIPFGWQSDETTVATTLQVVASDALDAGHPVLASADAVAAQDSGQFTMMLPPVSTAMVMLKSTATPISLNGNGVTVTTLLWNDCGGSVGDLGSCVQQESMVTILDTCASFGSTSFDCPDSAIEGQMGHCLYKYELTTAVPALISYVINGVEGNCRYAGAEIGGSGQGGADQTGDYLIVPHELGIARNTDLPIAVDVLVIDIAYEYLGPTRCRQGIDTVEYLSDPTTPVSLFDITTVTADISLEAMSLGSMSTVGGYSRTDRAIAVGPDVTEYTVVTSSDRVLALTVATISHNDGWANSDWGEFSITPNPDMSLMPELLPGQTLTDLGTLTNNMKLADDTSSTVWHALTTIAASEDGTENTVCLHGQYMDDGSPNGPADTCLKVTGVKEENAALLIPEDLQHDADVVLERAGSIMVPIGGNTFVVLTKTI